MLPKKHMVMIFLTKNNQLLRKEKAIVTPKKLKENEVRIVLHCARHDC